MNSQITDKMKEALLNSLPKRYEISNSLSPILEHDFCSVDSWFLDNLPMLRVSNTQQHFLQPTLNHLEKDGYIVSNKSKMTFRLTAKGLGLITPTHKDNNHTNKSADKNILKCVFSNTYIQIVLGGLLVLYFWHNVLGN